MSSRISASKRLIARRQTRRNGAPVSNAFGRQQYDWLVSKQMWSEREQTHTIGPLSDEFQDLHQSKAQPVQTMVTDTQRMHISDIISPLHVDSHHLHNRTDPLERLYSYFYFEPCVRVRFRHQMKVLKFGSLSLAPASSRAGSYTLNLYLAERSDVIDRAFHACFIAG